MRKSYKDDAESLYTLLLQHVGTPGPGSHIIENHKNYKNGRRCYLGLKESHDQTKHHHGDERKISEAKYSGGNRNWKLKDCYNIISKSFNDLEKSGGVYALSEEQKTQKFECEIKESFAISYYI